MTQSAEELLTAAAAWWSTALIDIRPGEIGIAGYPIQDLIGNLSFPQMVWLMLRGEVPTAERAKLLEAAMVAAVDHRSEERRVGRGGRGRWGRAGESKGRW